MIPYLLILLAPCAAAGFEFSGIVIDSADVPVAGADVWFAQEWSVLRTQTDAQGRFVFDSVETGPTDIVARKEGLAIGGISGPLLGPDNVTVRLGKPGVLTMRVIDHTYAPLEGARVSSLLVDDTFHIPLTALAEYGFPIRRSNAEGILEIDALPEGGHVQLIVTHRKCADTSVAYLPIGGERQNITMSAGVTLRGRVTDDTGQAVSDAHVAVFRVGLQGRRGFGEAVTDPEGYYAVRVAPGEYLVAARHPGFASPPPQTAVLKSEDPKNVVDIPLVKPCGIEGSAAGPEGKPFPGVLAAYWIGENLYAETLSCYDGCFTLDIPPGEGVLRIVPPDGYMTEDVAVIPVKAQGERHAQLSPIRLKPLPSIQCTILDPDGKPVPNALVTSKEPARLVWDAANAQGVAELKPGRVPDEGKATFRAEHPVRFLRAEFTVDLRECTPVTVRLEPYEPDVSKRPDEPGANNLSALVDKPALELECDAWYNAESLSLAKLKGKVLVLLFWGGFDRRPESRDEVERVRALETVLRDAGDVVFLGLHDSSAEKDDVKTYIEERGLTFPVARDTEPFRTFERYYVQYIPQIVLVDKAGNVRFYQTAGRLHELVKALRREQ